MPTTRRSFTTSSQWTDDGEVLILATDEDGQVIASEVMLRAREAAEELSQETDYSPEAARVVARKTFEAMVAGRVLDLLNGDWKDA